MSAASEATVLAPTQKELRHTIFSMVWPVAIENVLQLLIGFVNTGMVGRLGAATILAVGLAGRVGMFVWIIFGAIGMGTTVLIARAVGAGQKEDVTKIAQQAFIIGLSVTGFVAAAVFFLAPSMLVALRATEDAMPVAIAYLKILAFSIPFQALTMVVSSVLRGTGNTRTPMQIALVMNIVNVLSNSVLIFGRFGIPALGSRGPAVSSIISQSVGSILGIAYLVNSVRGAGIRFWEEPKVDLPLVRRIMGVGIPSSAEMAFWQIAAVLLVRIINDFGTVAGAAYQLGVQAEGISYMPTAGFSIAATALVGQSLGGKNVKLAERYIKEIVRWGVMLTTVTTAILVFGPQALMRILTDDKEVIVVGARYILLMGLSQIPQQLAGTLGGALRGAGDTITPMVGAALGICGCRIPAAFLLSRIMGIQGVWWAINADHFVRLSVVGWRYLQGKWRLSVENGIA